MNDRQPLIEQQILPQPGSAPGQPEAIRSLRQAFNEARAAHISIDLQRCYCEPGHSYNSSFPELADRAAALAEPVNELADAMRGAGLRTIWVAHAFKGAINRKPEIKPETYRERIRMAKRELYGVRRNIADSIVCKDHFDAFEETPLDRILKKRGVTTLLLTGAFFDQCVRATASTAAKLGYEVAVVRDLSVAVAYNLAPCMRGYEQDGVKMLRAREVLGILK